MLHVSLHSFVAQLDSSLLMLTTRPTSPRAQESKNSNTLSPNDEKNGQMLRLPSPNESNKNSHSAPESKALSTPPRRKIAVDEQFTFDSIGVDHNDSDAILKGKIRHCVDNLVSTT